MVLHLVTLHEGIILMLLGVSSNTSRTKLIENVFMLHTQKTKIMQNGL